MELINRTEQQFRYLIQGSICFLLICVQPAFAEGGLGLGATRLISRITCSMDGKESTPFSVSPPLFRLEPGSSGILRITGNTAGLPQDRESVFWLSVSGVAAGNPLSRDSVDGFVDGGVSYAVGNIIKVFYRPTGLPSSAAEAAAGLVFSLEGDRIQVLNASPYYVSLSSLNVDGRKIAIGKVNDSMVPPQGEASWSVGRASPLSRSGIITWTAVVNLGEKVKGSAKLQ